MIRCHQKKVKIQRIKRIILNVVFSHCRRWDVLRHLQDQIGGSGLVWSYWQGMCNKLIDFVAFDFIDLNLTSILNVFITLTVGDQKRRRHSVRRRQPIRWRSLWRYWWGSRIRRWYRPQPSSGRDLCFWQEGIYVVP